MNQSAQKTAAPPKHRAAFIERAVVSGLVGAALSCAQGKALLIRTDVDAEVTRLNPEQGGIQSMGQTPLRLYDMRGPYIMTLNRPGFLPQSLVIVEGDEARGRLDFKLLPDEQQVDGLLGPGRRLDRLLKAHRAFLRGQIGDASALLAAIERDAGADFGVLVLKGNIATVEGRLEDARQYFNLARQVYPEYEAKMGPLP